MTHILYLALGSNTGNRHHLLREAIRLIGQEVGEVTRTSSFIETEPWGFVTEHRFINACIQVQTKLTPREVLLATQDIERRLGRTRKSDDGAYHDRPIDIDILLYDDWHIDEPGLKVPHPLMRERDFVMIPLREILPNNAASK